MFLPFTRIYDFTENKKSKHLLERGVFSGTPFVKTFIGRFTVERKRSPSIRLSRVYQSWLPSFLTLYMTNTI